MTTERVEAGFQIGFHAIGDRANHMALDAFGALQPMRLSPKLPARGKNPLIIHGVPAPASSTPRSYPRQTSSASPLSNVIASMQPSHLLTDMNWAEARLGPNRVKYSYAWRSFLDHGVTLAFGTDYPVESINPFRGLYAAITRQNEAGTKTYQPQEKITLNEAIYAYTQASAFAENQENSKAASNQAS